MFAITNGTGFHITFPSGITLSTQFGGGNYCINYDLEIGIEKKKSKVQSKNAEIAIWDEEGKWLTNQAYKELFNEEIGDDVKGNVEIEEWLKILDWCQGYKLEEKTEEVSNE